MPPKPDAADKLAEMIFTADHAGQLHRFSIRELASAIQSAIDERIRRLEFRKDASGAICDVSLPIELKRKRG